MIAVNRLSAAKIANRTRSPDFKLFLLSFGEAATMIGADHPTIFCCAGQSVVPPLSLEPEYSLWFKLHVRKSLP